LATFKSKVPPRRELVLVFTAAVVTVNIWSIMGILREVPAWIVRMSAVDMVGVIGYLQGLALFESMLVFLAVVALALALPRGWLADKFGGLGSSIIILSSLGAVFLHLMGGRLRSIGFVWLILAALVVILLIGGWTVMVWRSVRLRRTIEQIVERAAVLAAVYLVLNGFGVLIILARNLVGWR
jgi:hypothetical protein